VNDKAKLELWTLDVALGLGILADLLLRTFPWGVNFALWAALLVAAAFLLGRQRKAFDHGGGWLMLPLLLAPLAFLWHDSVPLNLLNLLALGIALALLVLRAQGARLRVSGLVKYALGGIITGLNTTFGIFPLLFGSTEWKKSAHGSRALGAVLRGVAFSLLPLLVFGSLMMAADAVFNNLVHRVFHFGFTDSFLIGLFAAWVGGYLRGLLFGNELSLAPAARSLPFALGSIETGVLLGLLDLLFLAFVVVQVRYFFGGSALVHATTGLTYSEYARRGFFELLAVAALVLPLLLFTAWLLRPDDAVAQRCFRWLAGIQIGLLFVIITSAFQRLRLYEAEYGLSEQRLYPTAFLVWLAVVFVWFSLTVMRGERERFAFGAMVAGFLLIAALHLVNPDALIARTNLARARTTGKFDAHYAASLSDDAVPEMVRGLSAVNPAERCELAKALLGRLPSATGTDWRSWSYARAQAREILQTNQSALQAACTEMLR